MFLLRFRRRHRFGPEADSLPRRAPIPCIEPHEQIPFDPEEELDGHLDAVEFAPELPPEEEPAPDWAADCGSDDR
jgi:hypothetical protein